MDIEEVNNYEVYSTETPNEKGPYLIIFNLPNNVERKLDLSTLEDESAHEIHKFVTARLNSIESEYFETNSVYAFVRSFLRGL